MLASVITNEVGTLLNDMEPGYEHVRWPLPDLLNYITEGIAAIAQGKPSVFVIVAQLALGPGSTQTLPLQYSRLLDVHFNINKDGTEGPNVLPGVYALQQAFEKPTCISNALIQTYSAFPGSERYFFVNPPVPRGLNYIPKIEALVQLVPQIVTSENQPLFIPGSDPVLFQAALTDWCLYRSYGVDQESQTSWERSQGYLRAWQVYMGIAVDSSQSVKKSSGQNTARAQQRAA